MDIKPENIFLTKPLNPQDMEDMSGGSVVGQTVTGSSVPAPGSDDSATLMFEDQENQPQGADHDPGSDPEDDDDDDEDEDEEQGLVHEDAFDDEEKVVDESEGDAGFGGELDTSEGHLQSTHRTANHSHQRNNNHSSSDTFPDLRTCGGQRVRFKIGDFGLVTESPARFWTEGDSRYLAPELLTEGSGEKDLTKGDIFALGMTLVEVMTGSVLPKNGDEWRKIRSGDGVLDLDPGHRFPASFCHLIQSMIREEPSDRPSAADIVQRLEPTKSQILRQLNNSRNKERELEQQLNDSNARIEELEEMNRQLMSLTPVRPASDGRSILTSSGGLSDSSF